MSSAGPRRENRGLMFLGHYSWVFLVVLVVLDVANDATLAHWPVLSRLVGVAWVLWLFDLMIVDKSYHDARLCERCIAATPLNPEAAAERWDRCLQLEHSGFRMSLVLFTVVGLNLWIQTYHDWIGYLTDALVLMSIVVVYGAEYAHRRLYPWCPYCHWRDGGDPEYVPEHDPDPGVSK